MPGDVQQGVAGVSRHHLQLADEVAAIGWQRKRRALQAGVAHHASSRASTGRQGTERTIAVGEGECTMHFMG